MATETLREFLVSLGFHTDETSLKKFMAGVLGVTGPVLKLGTAAIATATAVEVMVERVAHQMSDLYYAAQRSNSTVGAIQAVGFAAKQVGLSAATGEEMLGGLARAMRENPGSIPIIERFAGPGGIERVNGQLGVMQRGLTNILEGLKALSDSGEFFMANRWAARMGMPTGDPLYQTLANLTEWIAAQKQKAALQKEMGFDIDKAASKFRAFSLDVNKLELALSYLADTIALRFLPASDKFVKWATDAVIHLKPLGDGLQAIADDLQAVLSAVERLWAVFQKINAATGGVAGKAFEAVTGGIPALVATQPDVVTDPSKMPIHAEKAWLWDHLKAGGSWVLNHLPLGIRHNNPLNLQPGGQEATFSSPLEGAEAAIAQLMRYGGRKWNSLTAIVSHWDAGDTPARIKSYIADVSQRTGYAAGQQLDLTDPTVLARVASAMTFHEQGMNPYGPGLYARAAAGATLNQSTNITVNGASDPAQTAKRIGQAQGSVNSNLIRYLESISR